MSALGAYGCAVVAALTAQNTQRVTGILPVDPAFVRQQIDTLWADVRIDAVKIGMLGQASVVRAVAEALQGYAPTHLVLDPVMVAKSGDLLLEREAISMMVEALLPQVTVLMPNLPEAGVLLDQCPVGTVREMRRVAERLRECMAHSGQRWVMLKGGHLPDADALDLLHDGDRMIELPARRIDTPNTHGTGCTLSAALAALLPQTGNVPEAAERAKRYLTDAVTHSDRLHVGTGHGPVHHFHAWW
jgi:hydroxymethylpyrimidine/phosphomethylpyrimidine kinase